MRSGVMHAPLPALRGSRPPAPGRSAGLIGADPRHSAQGALLRGGRRRSPRRQDVAGQRPARAPGWRRLTRPPVPRPGWSSGHGEHPGARAFVPGHREPRPSSAMSPVLMACGSGTPQPPAGAGSRGRPGASRSPTPQPSSLEWPSWTLLERGPRRRQRRDHPRRRRAGRRPGVRGRRGGPAARSPARPARRGRSGCAVVFVLTKIDQQADWCDVLVANRALLAEWCRR